MKAWILMTVLAITPAAVGPPGSEAPRLASSVSSSLAEEMAFEIPVYLDLGDFARDGSQAAMGTIVAIWPERRPVASESRGRRSRRARPRSRPVRGDDRQRRRRWMVVGGALVLGLAVFGIWVAVPSKPAGVRSTAPAPLTDTAQAGKILFDRHCASCHGLNAAGTARGPALVHRMYHPSHHADVAFELAVRRGVRAHHYRFGDMPPQPSVTTSEVAQITRYVRELQNAAGIY